MQLGSQIGNVVIELMAHPALVVGSMLPGSLDLQVIAADSLVADGQKVASCADPAGPVEHEIEQPWEISCRRDDRKAAAGG